MNARQKEELEKIIDDCWHQMNEAVPCSRAYETAKERMIVAKTRLRELTK